MKPLWERYCEDIKSGKIPSGNSIKKAVERFERFKNRDDIYFDSDEVEKCISFIGTMKHFLGKSAGTYFKLEPWQTFLLANIFGLKWKENGRRVCRETYIQIARKAGKDALMAAICLYLLIAEGEASPQIVGAANSTDQARILFEYITKFGQSIDPKNKILKPYRNYIKCPANDGIVKVISSDAGKMDGLNLSAFVIDEYHQSKTREMYDVLKSSQSMRTNPLAIIITTAGFDLNAPCHDMYDLGHDVLDGIKTMDNFFPLIWELDPEDDWKTPDNFIKCQPNLDVTATKDFMLEEVQKAEMDSTAVTGVMTKTFNIWVQSKITWIPRETIAGLMERVYLEEHKGKNVILGLDLGSVSDFTSLTVFIPPTDTEKMIFKTWCFLPEQTLIGHPHELLYRKFIQEGSMIITPGNVFDQDFLIAKIGELSRIVNISAIYLDKWNAVQTQVKMTELGYNVQEFSQAIGNYNGCTKFFETEARKGNMIIDTSSCVLWQFGNVFLKQDFNGNVKPSKESAYKKIDSVISMTTALGGWLKNPVSNDFEIYVL